MGNDSILNKVQRVEEALARITAHYISGKTDVENDLDAQDVILLNLTRACEQTIKMAMQIVRQKKIGLPDNYKDSFVKLADAKLIPIELAKQLGSMVGFRNLAVHAYHEIDFNILKSILDQRLNTFSEFNKIALKLSN